jgi:hypothetical protein
MISVARMSLVLSCNEQGGNEMQTRLFVAAALMAFGLLSVGQASAHEFTATKNATVNLKNIAVTKFTFTAGSTICKTVKSMSGTLTVKENGVYSTLLPRVEWSNCEAFGKGANVSTVWPLFDANNKFATGEMIITTLGAGSCSVMIKQQFAESLKKVEYKEVSNSLEADVSVEEQIHYVPSGGVCGTANKEETNGSLSGDYRLEPSSGGLSWK